MSILVDKDTKVIVQGITGRSGRFHTQQCVEYGTQIVAGVTPGRGGSDVDGISVYDTVSEAVEATGADTSVIFVPARFDAADSIMEAADAGINLIVCITEGAPVLDMIKAKRFSGRAAHSTDWAKLPRRNHARRMQDWDHARLYPSPRQNWHRFSKWNLNL